MLWILYVYMLREHPRPEPLAPAAGQRRAAPPVLASRGAAAAVVLTATPPRDGRAPRLFAFLKDVELSTH